MAKRKRPDSFTDMEPESKLLKIATCITLNHSADEMKETLGFSPEQVVSLAQTVFAAAARGEDMIMSSVLSGLHADVAGKVLQVCFSQPRTPLHVAVASGHTRVVRYFLNNSETRKYVGEQIQKLSKQLLNVAARYGDKEIVQLLLSEGAHVNEVDARHRTALHEACRFGHVSIVRYLLSLRAHTDCVDVDGNTCLMDACRGGHHDAVQLLLEAGAEPSQSGPDQVTALHVAAERDAVKSVCLLLQYGASMSTDSSGQTPLSKAILKCSTRVIYVLAYYPQTSRWDRIKALEFLGVVGIADESEDEAFDFWCAAMEEKHKHPAYDPSLVCDSPRPTLLNVAQSRTMDELLSLRSNKVGQLIESVLILEKVAGQQCPLIPEVYTDLCEALAKNDRFSDVLSVFNRGMKMFSSVFKVDDFYQYMFSSLCDAAEQGKKIEFATIEESLLLVVQGIEQGQTGQPKKHSAVLVAFCRLLIINARIATRDDNEMERLKSMVTRLVKLLPQSDNTSSLPHDIIWYLLKSEGDSVKQHIQGIVELIAACGANMNAVDLNGNTPLHDAALWNESENKERACLVSENLLYNGAHIDTPNIYGQTALDVANPTVKAVLRRFCPLSLQCLAASTVVRERVPYIHRVPNAMKNFIQLHVPGQV